MGTAHVPLESRNRHQGFVGAFHREEVRMIKMVGHKSTVSIFGTQKSNFTLQTDPFPILLDLFLIRIWL